MSNLSLLSFLLLLLLHVVSSFYLPGVAPRNYLTGDLVDLKVNRLTSVKTQVPFSYYSLPWCRPEKIVESSENLGEVLRGDIIENSCYTILANVHMPCQVLCVKEHSTKDIKKIASSIDDQYRHHWLLDNLPAAQTRTMEDQTGNSVIYYEEGFPIGSRSDTDRKSYFLNNHIQMKISFHQENDGTIRIVGFEVIPQSIEHSSDFDPKDTNSFPKTCLESTGPQVISRKQKSVKVVYTYSVEWIPSEVKWASRWDIYLQMSDDLQIHWFSIINSLMVVLFLTGIVAMIMMRTLRADFRRYSIETQEEEEESGWKLVHGDVFRPPSHPLLLSVFVGSGVQVFWMFFITMVFAIFGFLSPANRGALMTCLVVLFFLMGVVAGYTSSRLAKTLRVQNWKRVTITTALLFPGIIFAIFLILNIALSFSASSGAVPFQTLLILMGLWFGVSSPLVFFGGQYANKFPPVEAPVRTHQIPRQVPEQIWYMQPFPSMMIGGILPFGAIFIELFFILTSIWQNQFYYMFSFLFIVFFILVLTCSEITIVLCYFQLCCEDYHWWWRSFLTSGASAIYMFLYSIFYFFVKLEIVKFVSGLLFFGYTAIMCLCFFLVTGCIGFFSCFFFVRKIYSSIKID